MVKSHSRYPKYYAKERKDIIKAIEKYKLTHLVYGANRDNNGTWHYAV